MRKSDNKKWLSFVLGLALTMLFCMGNAFAATNNDNDQQKKPGWDGGIGVIHHPGSGNLTGATSAGSANPGTTASAGVSSPTTATSGAQNNTATYRQTNSKPGNSGPLIGGTNQDESLNKETTSDSLNKETASGSTVPVSSKITPWVKKTSKKKSVSKQYKTTWRKGQHLTKNQKKELKYMKQWCNGRNGKYPVFYDDCTNYVSQLAHAGGWKKTSRGKEKKKLIHGYRCDDKKKWYAGMYKVKTWHGTSWGYHKVYTSSWTTVNGFWHYATKVKKAKHFTTKSMSKVIREAHFGDTVQFYANGSWFHSVTISKVGKHMVYYTSHGNNYLAKSLSHCNNGRSGKYKITKFRLIKMGIK